MSESSSRGGISPRYIPTSSTACRPTLLLATLLCHRKILNMELYLQSKVYLGSMWIAVLIGWDLATPSPPPRIWAHIRGRYWSAKMDDISLWPPGHSAMVLLANILYCAVSKTSNKKSFCTAAYWTAGAVLVQCPCWISILLITKMAYTVLGQTMV